MINYMNMVPSQSILFSVDAEVKSIVLKVEMEGLTGFIKFDTQGLRTIFHLDVLELTPEGLSTICTWHSIYGANFTRPATAEVMSSGDENLVNKTLRVSSKLVL